MIGSGFSFQDEHQILVSVQKPLGLVLEQDQGDDTKDAMIVVAAETDPNGTGAMAGVQVGDVLVAVQNTSVEGRPLEEVLRIIGSAPNVLNLRFLRHRTRA
jgi:C-terminal processing protease CtpA/Prc